MRTTFWYFPYVKKLFNRNPQKIKCANHWALQNTPFSRRPFLFDVQCCPAIIPHLRAGWSASPAPTYRKFERRLPVKSHLKRIRVHRLLLRTFLHGFRLEDNHGGQQTRSILLLRGKACSIHMADMNFNV